MYADFRIVTIQVAGDWRTVMREIDSELTPGAQMGRWFSTQSFLRSLGRRAVMHRRPNCGEKFRSRNPARWQVQEEKSSRRQRIPGSRPMNCRPLPQPAREGFLSFWKSFLLRPMLRRSPRCSAAKMLPQMPNQRGCMPTTKMIPFAHVVETGCKQSRRPQKLTPKPKYPAPALLSC